MKNEDKKYTTGEIARICSVTKKQLRYYEENDILNPKYKDENTKYRYYSESQIEEILMIKDLKKADFSLRDISDILKGRDIPLLKKRCANKSISQKPNSRKHGKHMNNPSRCI